MRIISGIYKGRQFQLPKDLKARPTTDFAKESLFNILQNDIDFEQVCVLDLFSGTGNIAMEFVSRGAKQVTCVERYAPHVRFIRSVREKLCIRQPIIIQGDVYQFIQRCEQSFDIIFADAPYDDPQLGQIPERIFQAGMLRPGGTLIVEHSKKNDFSTLPYWTKMRQYGSVHFSFFHLKTE